jgi:Porin subfamily
MRKMKGLLLGGAAALATAASAQAADLPVKAAPVEYVKVCSLYGAGFFYIPGTDTCLKIGGYLRADHIYGMANAGGYYMSSPGAQETRTSGDMYSYRARMNLTVDFRTQSDYGTIRAYAAIIAQQSQGDFAPAGFIAQSNGSAGILRAFIQFAGFTVGHAVSYYDFMNGADYGYLPSIWSTGTGVNGTDLIAYTWQIGNGFSASIDIEDPGNGQNNPLSALGGGIAPGTGTPGTGRGKMLINSSLPSSLGTAGSAVSVGTDTLRSDMPDLAGNLRVDQAWGSAQIMAAIHNASGGYYTNVPGALTASSPSSTPAGATGTTIPAGIGALPAGIQVFGHPGEAWGWAVGGGAKFVNFLLPRDQLEFQANFCQGAYAYCDIPALYTQNFMYGRANTVAMGYAFDGIFNNGGQVQLTNSASFAVGYQHYWNQQWRTSVAGGMDWNWFNSNAQSQLCGTAPGSAPVGAAGGTGLFGMISATTGVVGGQTLHFNCSPNWNQASVSTRTAWNPHPFLEIGLDLIWFHQQTANAGSVVALGPQGARPAGVYTFNDQDGYAAVLRFQKNILP